MVYMWMILLKLTLSWSCKGVSTGCEEKEMLKITGVKKRRVSEDINRQIHKRRK